MKLQIHFLFYLAAATAFILYLFIFIYKRYNRALRFRDRNYVDFYNAVMCNRDLTDIMRDKRRKLFLKQRPSMFRLMLLGGPYIRQRYYSIDQINFFFKRGKNGHLSRIADHVKSKYDFTVIDQPIAMLSSGKYVNGVLTPVNE